MRKIFLPGGVENLGEVGVDALADWIEVICPPRAVASEERSYNTNIYICMNPLTPTPQLRQNPVP